MHPSDFLNTSNNLFPTRTQHRHTHQITDQDDCRPGQSEKNDEEVKRKWGVKVRRVQGGKGQEGRMKGKESRKQAESEEEEEGGENEQQRQEGGGEKAKDERAGERRSDKQGRSGGQVCCRRSDTFANCLKDSGGDFLDRLPKHFRTQTLERCQQFRMSGLLAVRHAWQQSQANRKWAMPWSK